LTLSVDPAPSARQLHLARIEDLLRQGRDLVEGLTAAHDRGHAVGLARPWQQACAALVSDLSGGSKAHWLSRAHSEAFLVRALDGRAIEQAPMTEIAVRLIAVLEQARASLLQTDAEGSVRPQPAAPHRFDFVHNASLRPVLEAAYLDSRRALEQGRFAVALVTASGLLEAIVTDALSHADRNRLAAQGAPEGPITGWTFDERIATAERAGIIRGGCARLPTAARRYAELAGRDGKLGANVEISERDARTAGQVLHVVMRDLDPGR
jgi:hypothetical protein